MCVLSCCYKNQTTTIKQKQKTRAGEVAQRGKALVVKAGDLRSTHTVGEN